MPRKSETIIEQICGACPRSQEQTTISLINLDEDKHPWVPGAVFISGAGKFDQQLRKAGWKFKEDINDWVCSRCA